MIYPKYADSRYGIIKKSTYFVARGGSFSITAFRDVPRVPEIFHSIQMDTTRAPRNTIETSGKIIILDLRELVHKRAQTMVEKKNIYIILLYGHRWNINQKRMVHYDRRLYIAGRFPALPLADLIATRGSYRKHNGLKIFRRFYRHLFYIFFSKAVLSFLENNEAKLF
uniref:Uncharacterized protein n=1 Tax=Trichogramma kaykai TaxID=54128 RepID=A0ABD2XQN2_9HYME